MKKKWGIENFYNLGKLLKKKFNNFKIIITGSKYESKENEILEQKLKIEKIEVENLTGKLTFKEILNVINNSKWLISSDTSIAHLSALTLTNSVTIFLGGCYHYHTYPYQINKYVIFPDLYCYPCKINDKCDKMECKNNVTPEKVFSIICGEKVKNSLKTIWKDNFIKLI